MKQIVFDCERMKYTNTGLYHYCLNLGLHLQQAVNNSSEGISFYTPPGVKRIFGGKSISQNFLQKFYMPALKKFNIWHVTHQDSSYAPVRNRKIKVVLTIHDLNFLYDPGKSDAKKQKYLHRVQSLINRADAVVCISEYCRKDVLANCYIGSKPLHVIYNGTNTLTEPDLFRHSYKPEKPFLFSLGVITRKKNFHTLLPLLQNNEMELVIAGRQDDTDYFNYINNMALRMGVQNNFRLLGQISEKEKSWYLKNCYAFALPSISEGFGAPVAEAMAFGKPLFLSDRTALPEIGSNVAFYFPDFNAKQMQNTFSTGMRDYKVFKMYDAIKKRGTDFCWHKSALEYLEVYRSLY
jgi:glycosyltransferase involved in cell wall biosynthesis